MVGSLFAIESQYVCKQRTILNQKAFWHFRYSYILLQSIFNKVEYKYSIGCDYEKKKGKYEYKEEELVSLGSKALVSIVVFKMAVNPTNPTRK